MLQFVSRGLSGVLIQGRRIIFNKEVKSPCTIATDKSLGPGKHNFEVEFIEKDGRTSVGWMSCPPPSPSFYMTPRHTDKNDIYVSMGKVEQAFYIQRKFLMELG
mmetsp:Transcript_2500/g.6395  ORF Transcript_2500/g.6395 Transcript_2500/m.6395 type:complete len:104 (+) Transcript_2500:131-442(+)